MAGLATAGFAGAGLASDRVRADRGGLTTAPTSAQVTGVMVLDPFSAEVAVNLPVAPGWMLAIPGEVNEALGFSSRTPFAS